MALLIDGYNLLHATDIFAPPGTGTALHRSRLALLEFLAESLSQRERLHTTVVFDAAGAPPGLPTTLTHDQITVRFSRDYADADALLEELISACLTPKSLTVVSADHRVQRAARSRGAKYVDSKVWFSERRSKRHDVHNVQRPASSARPTSEITADDVEYWLQRFSEPLPPEDARRPSRRQLKSPPKSQPAPSARPQKASRQVKRKPRGGTEKPVFGEGIFPPGYAEDLADDLIDDSQS